MIIRQRASEVGFYMSEAAILAASVRAALTEVAKQAEALATGLQNAAPAEKTGVPNNSVLYLLNIAETINNIVIDCEKIQSTSN